MERKAVFVLDLWVPPKDVDLAMEPSKAVVQLSVSTLHLELFGISF